MNLSKKILTESLKILHAEYKIRELKIVEAWPHRKTMPSVMFDELAALQTNSDRVHGLIFWLEQGESTGAKE